MKIFRFLGRKKPIEHTPPTYKEFLNLHRLCSEEVRKEDEEILSKQPRPEYLCGERVPESLNLLTYGQLDDMRNITDKKDIAYQLSYIVFGKTLNLLDEDVNKVFGFVNFCASEVERINKLFSSLKHDYSAEERQAGVESLNFGSFGVLDWYAKRMGITNQNDVRDVAWVRIFKCMQNDHAQQEFEKRLQDIYMKKSRFSHHKK